MAVVTIQKEGRLAVIMLNRPEAMNALSPTVLRELGQVLADFENDDSLWVGIITGAGDRAFCAGADIKETLPVMREHPAELPPSPMKGLKVAKPLIAAVNGLALGGGLELVLICDIRIAAEKARFGLTETTVGLIPGWGGTQRLPRMVSWCIAAEMMFTGKLIDATEAYRIGLVNAVVPFEKLMATAREMAEAVCKAAPLAVRAAKEAMVRGADTSVSDGLAIETELENRVMQTADFMEGITAFSAKRKPNYLGR